MLSLPGTGPGARPYSWLLPVRRIGELTHGIDEPGRYPASAFAIRVLFSEVVGGQLEELLWELVEEIGAPDIVRGAASAVA